MFPALGPRSLALVITESSVCIALNLMSLVGNLMVCFALYRSTRLRATATNLFIAALAITDLLSATVIMPMTTGTLIKGGWVFGDVACKIHGFVMHFSLYASASTIALTAFNRYTTVAKPSLSLSVFTKKRSRIILATVWLLVILYVLIPIFVGWSNFTFHPGHSVCLAKFTSEEGTLAHYSIIIPIFVIFPLLVASVSYYKISKLVKLHNFHLASCRRLANTRLSAQEIQITKSIIVVAFTFIICWVPTWVVVALNRFGIVENMPRNAHLLCTYLFFVSNSLNPVIYAGMNPCFKREFGKMLNCGRNAMVSSEIVHQNKLNELNHIS